MENRRNYSSGSPYEPVIGFSRGVRVGNRVIISGTAPISLDESPFAPGDPARQTTRCLEIIAESVEALGLSLEDVVRTRIYLTHRDDWEAVGRAHGEFFKDIRPASTMVVVAALLDSAWRVEIEAEAQVDL